MRFAFAASLQTGLGDATSWPLLRYHVEAVALPSFPGCSEARNLTLPPLSSPLDRVETRQEGLAEGCEYRWKVRAENVAGFSDWSAAVDRMALSLPTAPTFVSAVTRVALRAALAWQVPNNTGDGRARTASLVTSFLVEVSLTPEFPAPLLRVYSAAADQRAINIDLLEQDVPVHIRISTSNE
ncbi:hypothetical protein T484DRAFT_1848119, partial [Baffinella frigidus]